MSDASFLRHCEQKVLIDFAKDPVIGCWTLHRYIGEVISDSVLLGVCAFILKSLIVALMGELWEVKVFSVLPFRYVR